MSNDAQLILVSLGIAVLLVVLCSITPEPYE